jgi:hypothetical protein
MYLQLAELYCVYLFTRYLPDGLLPLALVYCEELAEI